MNSSILSGHSRSSIAIFPNHLLLRLRASATTFYLLPLIAIVYIHSMAYNSMVDSRRRVIFGRPWRNMDYDPINVDTKMAKQNILRLFHQKEPAPELFAIPNEYVEKNPKHTSFVKLGVCYILSAPEPDNFRREFGISYVLESLFTYLRIILEEANPITKDQGNFISRLRQQLEELVASPNFIFLSCEALFTKFMDIFVPKDSPTREEVMSSLSLPVASPWPSRKRVGKYLNRSFENRCYTQEIIDREWSGCFIRHVNECLSFNYDGIIPYSIGERTIVEERCEHCGNLLTESGLAVY
jgi:hypothetical protein